MIPILLSNANANEQLYGLVETKWNEMVYDYSIWGHLQ